MTSRKESEQPDYCYYTHKKNQTPIAPSATELNRAYTSIHKKKKERTHTKSRAIKERIIRLHPHHMVTPSTLCPHISCSSINSNHMRKSNHPATISTAAVHLTLVVMSQFHTAALPFITQTLKGVKDRHKRHRRK